MNMKKFFYIPLVASLALTTFACSDDEDGAVPCTDIINLVSEGLPGAIKLSWDYPEGESTIRYVEIRYNDPQTSESVRKTVSRYTDTLLIEDTREKDGEYTFEVQPFSQTFTAGAVHRISETSQRAPIQEKYSSTELALTAEDIDIPGMFSSDPASLFDGNNATYVNFDYSSASAGVVRYYDIHYPVPQEFLKFSYVNRDHSAAKFPAIIECYVKAQEADEWTLVTTLTQEEDALPTAPSAMFVSKEYRVPFEFNYFRFRVPAVHTGDRISNFSPAEFRVYDVDYSYFDPEEE